jgi:hypothetical protein
MQPSAQRRSAALVKGACDYYLLVTVRSSRIAHACSDIDLLA